MPSVDSYSFAATVLHGLTRWAMGAVLFVFSFVSPARSQRPAQTAPDGLVATIPTATDAGTSILIQVRLNEESAQWWVLDTGASECIVDRSAAQRAGLVTRGGRQVRGAGKGTVRLDSIRSRVNLRLADRALATCDHFASIDLRNATGGGREIAGILGYEFFMRYIVRVDFSAHEIKLYDPVRFRFPGRADTLAIAFRRRLPLVAVRIRTAHRPEVTRHLIVDTGSEDAVDDSTVRRNPSGPAVTVQTTGLGSPYQVVIGTLDTVIIGRQVLTAVPGVASEVGIVGNGIWSRYICTFDYPHQRVFLESR